ncbi:DUF7159 family protein [Mycolicibacter acidiphilus]|uniref:DUF7159 family protein n=1 Tax=Mycolicibacter acidiphilus TaxID=2835306 RepID=UPI003FD75046
MLGLSLTSTTIGWALVDGRADAAVSGDEFAVSGSGGASDALSVSAVTTAAIGVVARVQMMLAARGERLHGIGVTWSSGAAAAAALLLESLADGAVENVAPVRFSQAVESLAETVDPVAGATGAAVCVLESASATLVVFGSDNEVTIAEAAIGGLGDVSSWLAGLLGRGGPRPEVLVLAGSDRRGLDKLGRRLESQFSIPVFVQAGAQSALARGAALALAPHAASFGVPWGAPPPLDASPASSMSLSYAGALMMLTGGAATFVVSLSAALSMQLGPTKVEPQPAHVSVVRMASPAAPAPVKAPPPADAPPPPADAPPPAEAPPPVEAAPAADLPDSPTEAGTLWEPPVQNPQPVIGPPPGGKPSLLDRVKQHVPRLPGH